MKSNKAYTIEYIMNGHDEPQKCFVLAHSKEDAYYKALDEIVKHTNGKYPFGYWVAAVTYNNGNYQEFNTFCGKPY